MILKRLAEDYKHILSYEQITDPDDEDMGDRAPPSMYAEKPVRWSIELSSGGVFRRFALLSGGKEKHDRGLPLMVPFVIRTVNISPLLLADTPPYVLGVGEFERFVEDKRAVIKHEAFKALVKRCAEETGSSTVHAVSAFLDWWNATPERPALPDGMTPNDLITFDVRGERPIDEEAVQGFWARVCAEGAKTSHPLQCLVCGEMRPAVESMPVPVKGIPGGQTSGTALVSANSSVYESYGLTRATTSPICAECAEKYGKALNALLRGSSTHKRVGSLVYVFWTSKGYCEAAQQVGDPRPEHVRALIEAVEDATSRTLEDERAFYALSLSASAARAVVRDWLETTVGRINRHVGRWFAVQAKVPSPFGEPGKPFSDSVLAAALYRKKSTGSLDFEAIEARVAAALWRVALLGEPLPLDLLDQAILRNRADSEVSHERAVLITLILDSREGADLDTKEEHMTQTIDAEIAARDIKDEQARRCGRLLAILDEIQTAFARADNPSRKINTTLVDRYYGSASSAPATVFGTLLADAQAHLTKLRKSNMGAYDNLQRSLEETLEGLNDFPLTLPMRRQALFSLGYYHQRAEIRKARTKGLAVKLARQEATIQADTPPTDDDAVQTEGDNAP